MIVRFKVRIPRVPSNQTKCINISWWNMWYEGCSYWKLQPCPSLSSFLSNLDDGAVKPSLRNPSARTRARASPVVVGGMPDREMGPLSPFPHFPFSRPFLILCCLGSPVGRALRTSSLSSLSSSQHIPTPSVELFCFFLIPFAYVDRSRYIPLHFRYGAVCKETALILHPLTHREQCCQCYPIEAIIWALLVLYQGLICIRHTKGSRHICEALWSWQGRRDPLVATLNWCQKFLLKCMHHYWAM